MVHEVLSMNQGSQRGYLGPSHGLEFNYEKVGWEEDIMTSRHCLQAPQMFYKNFCSFSLLVNILTSGRPLPSS